MILPEVEELSLALTAKIRLCPVTGSRAGKKVESVPVSDKNSLTEDLNESNPSREQCARPIGLHIDHNKALGGIGIPTKNLDMPAQVGG